MKTSTSNAVIMSNREFYHQREAAALRRIPGAWELMYASEDLRPILEREYPHAAFALEILTNPFVADRELGAIRMEAYASILDGKNPAEVRRRYESQQEEYLQRHSWD